MARTKTNTRNDTKRRTSWRSIHLDKNYNFVFFIFLIVIFFKTHKFAFQKWGICPVREVK